MTIGTGVYGTITAYRYLSEVLVSLDTYKHHKLIAMAFDGVVFKEMWCKERCLRSDPLQDGCGPTSDWLTDWESYASSLSYNFSGRNLEFNPQATIHRVASSDHAAVQTRNAVRDRQAQPHPAGLPVARVL
jgi:hypothetical protein